ncbi:MAG: tetratricopeptide repeat protein [Moorea sp. SIO3H5]|nr:tetratricopeptide repeat protein [Moorena sp. SIO3H5]
MAGVGKTELALQYALYHKNKCTYTGGICWIQVGESDVDQQLLDFAESQLKFNFPDDWDLTKRLDHFWSYWPPLGDVLIIFDNVKNYEEINKCLPPQEQRFKVLITTRNQNLAESLDPLSLEVLDEEPAVELLTSFRGKSLSKDEEEVAKSICDWLGYLPLGLELVGRFLKVKSKLKLSQLMDKLQEQRLEHKALKKRSCESDQGLLDAFEIIWNELDNLGQQIGVFLSLFALAPINWELVIESLEDEKEKEEWDDAKDEKLVSLSLIKETESDSYQLHQLVREYFRYKLKQMPDAEIIKNNFCQIMVEQSKCISDTIDQERIFDTLTKKQLEQIEPLIPHLEELARNIKKNSFLENYLENQELISLFTGIGKFYQGKTSLDTAESWYQKCIQFISSKDQEYMKEYMTICLINLGDLYEANGKYQKAKELYQQALKQTEYFIKQDNILKAKVDFIKNNPVGLYEIIEQNQEAKNIYQQAKDYLLQVCVIQNNLAKIYETFRQDEKAENFYKEVLFLRKKLLGDQHLDVAISHNNLANIYFYKMKYQEAEKHYKQALEGYKPSLGSEHSHVATTLCNLADMYCIQKKYKESEELHLQALKLRKSLLGYQHRHVAISLKKIGYLYQIQGKIEKARYCQRFVELYKLLSKNE